MSEHFNREVQAARRQVSQYVVNHSGVELVIASEEPIPDDVLRTMLGVLKHEPLQPIGRRYTDLDIDVDGEPTKYDLNDKTILVELIGRSQLIYGSPRLPNETHDNTRAGIAHWAEARLVKLAPCSGGSSDTRARRQRWMPTTRCAMSSRSSPPSIGPGGGTAAVFWGMEAIMTVKKTGNNGAGCRGTPGPGRPKGLENKLTRSAKQALELAFEGIGGVEALTEWARENRGEFYKLYARLIPKPVEISGPEGAPITIAPIPTFGTAQEFAQWVKSQQTGKSTRRTTS